MAWTVPSSTSGPAASPYASRCSPTGPRPYPPALREQILSLLHTGTVEAVCRLHVAVGEMFARVANQTIRQAKLSAKDVAVIGSHGQTVWHSPKKVSMPGGPDRSGPRLQIGDPSVIAERTGIMTVADFVPGDLAAGGEGAPLTPYVHHHVFQSRKTSRLIVNLGGIANVTWLPRGGALQNVVAFDVGPLQPAVGWVDGARHARTTIDRSERSPGHSRARAGRARQRTPEACVLCNGGPRNPRGVKNSVNATSGASGRLLRNTTCRWTIRWRRVAPVLRVRFAGPGNGSPRRLTR